MQYFIGEGVKYQMNRLGDTPQSDEVFINDVFSTTTGEKYIYFAHKLQQPAAWGVYVAPRHDLMPYDTIEEYHVKVDYGFAAPKSHIAGWFAKEPTKVILHSSRSPSNNTVDQEYYGTARYLVANAQHTPQGETFHLGWNATIGEMRFAPHISVKQWGWNARGASSIFPGYEFAQSATAYKEGKLITDGQVIAFCAYAQHVIKRDWPGLYRRMLTTDDAYIEHWRLPEGILDGKSDVDPKHNGELTIRIRQTLNNITTILDNGAGTP